MVTVRKVSLVSGQIVSYSFVEEYCHTVSNMFDSSVIKQFMPRLSNFVESQVNNVQLVTTMFTLSSNKVLK